MEIIYLDIATIDLVDIMPTMDEAEALWDVAIDIHRVQIVYQMRSDMRLFLHIIDLDDFIGILVLLHRVYESLLAHCEMILLIVVFIAIL